MHLMAGASTISGDPAQIQNAILNLGINSRDAMPDGGELCFETKNVFVDATLVEKYLHEIACGDFIQITVRDTGCGMNDEVKAHLFEPFYTTKPIGKGTGMGLASVYGTVKSHKGAIQVFSEIGRGTAFHILLPMERPRRSSMPPVSAAPTDKLSSITDLRILIVDDEDSMRALFKDILLPAGNELLYAENGRVGLDVFSEQWPGHRRRHLRHDDARDEWRGNVPRHQKNQSPRQDSFGVRLQRQFRSGNAGRRRRLRAAAETVQPAGTSPGNCGCTGLAKPRSGRLMPYAFMRSYNTVRLMFNSRATSATTQLCLSNAL